MVMLLMLGAKVFFFGILQVFLTVFGCGLAGGLRGILGVAAAGGEAGGGGACVQHARLQLLQLFLGKFIVGQLRARTKAGQLEG